MKRFIVIVGLGAIAFAAVVMVKRFLTTDDSERVHVDAPPERAVPQARAS